MQQATLASGGAAVAGTVYGQSATMEDPVTYGGCNGCHRLPPRQEAPGRVSAAGGDDEGAP